MCLLAKTEQRSIFFVGAIPLKFSNQENKTISTPFGVPASGQHLNKYKLIEMSVQER